MKQPKSSIKIRDFAIDNFRGFIIVLLAFFFFYNTLNVVPDWLTHAGDGELLKVADFVAAGFMFMLVFAFTIGMERFVAVKDYGGAIKKYAVRYLGLIGVGFLLVAIPGLAGDISFQFNVFTAFGMAGLVSLCFIKLNKYHKLIAGFVLLIGYQIALQFIPGMMEYVLANDFGGLIGAISWCGFMLLAMFLSEVYRENSKKFTKWCLVFIGIAMVLATIDIWMKITGTPIDFFMAVKLRASLGYLLISLGLASAVFWLFAKFTKKVKIPILTWYGRNSLMMFLATAGVGQGFSMVANNFVSEQNIYFVLIGGWIVCVAVTSVIAYLLYRYNKIIAL